MGQQSVGLGDFIQQSRQVNCYQRDDLVGRPWQVGTEFVYFGEASKEQLESIRQAFFADLAMQKRSVCPSPAIRPSISGNVLYAVADPPDPSKPGKICMRTYDIPAAAYADIMRQQNYQNARMLQKDNACHPGDGTSLRDTPERYPVWWLRFKLSVGIFLLRIGRGR